MKFRTQFDLLLVPRSLFFILLFSLCIFPKLSAQSGKAKSLEKGNKWIYFGLEENINEIQELYEVVGDTIIFSEKYAIITHRRNQFYLENLIERADSTKIYCFSPVDSSEIVICDFNANVGDSLGSYLVSGQYSDYYWGQIRKFIRFYYEYSYLSWQEITYAKGIGWTFLKTGGLGHSNYTFRLVGVVLAEIVYGDTSLTIVDALPINHHNSGFLLHQNYPNPFNSATTIYFDLPEPAQIKIEIFNSLGQYLTTLTNKTENAGIKKIIWKPQGLISGIYYYKFSIKTNGNQKQQKEMGKMLYLK